MNILLIFISSVVYAFLFGLEITSTFSNKLRLELDKSGNKWTENALAFFYKNQNQFLSSLWLASVFSLFVYVSAVSSLTAFIEWNYNRILLVLLLIFFSVLFLLAVTDVVLRLLFRFNPTVSFRFFAQPLFVIYVLIYPLLKIYVFFFCLFAGRKDAGCFFSINKIYSYIEGQNNAQHTETRIEEVENEVRIFQNALDFSNVKLKNWIVPRTEIAAIELESTVAELKSMFTKSGYSRILVYKENIDNIVGYVHSSDMFDKPADIKSLLNPLIVVPETIAANKLLKLFLQQRKGIALVVDEFGGTAGIITLEDLMEVIFGEIEDEHDSEDDYIAKQLQPNEYVFSGRLEVDKINEEFGLQLPVSEDYITIAGLILFRNGMLPVKNQTVQIGKYQFSMLKITATRIELVRLKVLN
ncbi:MAG: hemolysin family protein [Prevotellaceae bacterium]|jgi:CBS domain containing-hemolysin-like protein|nr:hemolysin family protein [Prevotellaceae bacterium]